MAKGLYIGVSSKARKGKKAYIGVNNVARKIKKMYIGDANGKARLFFSGEQKLAYHGEITQLSNARSELSAGSVGNYVIFAGGDYVFDYDDPYGMPESTADAYNSSLTKVSVSNIGAMTKPGVANAGDYVIFTEYCDARNGVVAYNKSLTKQIAEGFYQYNKDTNMLGVSVNNHAVFIDTAADYYHFIYDSSLTMSTITASSLTRVMAAASLGNVAIAIGDSRGMSGYFTDYLITIDSSLSYNMNGSFTPYTHFKGAATAVGNYALFGGGSNSSDSVMYATVDVFNSSLTHSTASNLSAATTRNAATSVGNYALFGGGSGGNAVDVYDAALTKSTSTSFKYAKLIDLAAASVGNYALFGGGANNLGNKCADVYAYKLD